jgi:hypothetical protein
MNMADEALEFLAKGVEDMQGPPHTWIHALHQVTGLFAIKGSQITEQDKEIVKTILKDVLAEMEDAENWVFLQAGRGPRPDGSEPPG